MKFFTYKTTFSSLTTIKTVLTVLALATLVACSGGGGDSDPVATPTPTPVPGTPAPAPGTPTPAPTPTPVPAPTSSRQTCEATPNSTFDAASGTCTTCPPPSVYNQPGVCLTVSAPAPTPVPTPAPTPTPAPSPTITVPAAQPQNVKVYISAANTLPAGCNFTYEACWKQSVENGTVLIINGGGQNYAYYKADGVYMVRAIGSNGMLVYGSRSVTDYGVYALQDWVMGTSTGIIKHQATDNTCWTAANNQVACPA